MKKNDIKIGMVVETRDGDFYLIKEKEGDIILAGKYAWSSLSTYSDELKWCLNGKEHLLDIMKIYKCDACLIDTLFNKEFLTLLWERQRNKVTFQEAFKAYEEGKEIKSCVSNTRYSKSQANLCVIYEEILGEWYIN